jgi:hypothetical protein
MAKKIKDTLLKERSESYEKMDCFFSNAGRSDAGYWL